MICKDQLQNLQLKVNNIEATIHKIGTQLEDGSSPTKALSLTEAQRKMLKQELYDLQERRYKLLDLLLDQLVEAEQKSKGAR